MYTGKQIIHKFNKKIFFELIGQYADGMIENL